MMLDMNRSRWVAPAALLAVIVVAACSKDALLQPQNPGLIDTTAVTTATSALALRVGAIGRYRQVFAGEGNWEMAGTLTDEFKNADFLTVRIDVDQRTMDNSQTWSYNGVQQARGFIRDAISNLKTFLPDSTQYIGELYGELGFMEMSLADMYCNGIPLGHTNSGVVSNGSPLTTQQVYDSAITHFDSALAALTGVDSYSIYARRAALIYKARTLVMKGQYAAAAALVGTVPTSYQYDMTFSASSGSNPLWALANSTARITVGDSFDIVSGAPNVIQNALPFASANDPRLPVLNGNATSPKVPAEDGITTMWLSQLWKGQFDPWVLASGIDARLIEAEAALNVPDIPGMMTILNNLRAAKPTIGLYSVPAMAALPTPGSQAAAVTLFFREKAFWTFGRGQRLPDMRRMLRLYSTFYPNENKVFPKGTFFKGGTYGVDVNFPIPSGEQANPLFSACLDRLP
jgi:hypothetical protein